MTAYTLTATVPGSSLTGQFTVGSGALPVFGIPRPITDSGSTSWANIVAALGPVLTQRYYFTPSQNVPSASPQPPAGTNSLIVSFKPTVTDVLSGALTPALTALFKTVRPGDMWTCWHEAEAHLTLSQFQQMMAIVYPLFKQNAPASAKFGQIHMSYTASGFSSHGPLSQWILGGSAKLDFIGIDCYPVNNSDSWATMMNPVVSQVESVVPNPVWAICESNNDAAALGTDAQVTSYNTAGWNWAVVNNSLCYVSYWGNSPLIWPPSAAIISNLKSINAASVVAGLYSGKYPADY